MKGTVRVSMLAAALTSLCGNSYSPPQAYSEFALIQEALGPHSSQIDIGSRDRAGEADLEFTLEEVAAFRSESAPVAIGSPNSGRLLHGMKLEEGECLKPMRPERSYGTLELITTLRTAACNIEQEYGIPLTVLDMSKKGGGKFTWKDGRGRTRGHLSHQNGLDADVYQYVSTDAGVYSAQGRLHSNDTEALNVNWNFVKALQEGLYHTKVFWSERNIAILRRFVQREYGAREWEQYGEPILKGWRGHETHYHVRVLGVNENTLYGDSGLKRKK